MFVDVYHQTFLWPEDPAVAKRLSKEAGLSEQQHLAAVQRYRCQEPGLKTAYQHLVKVLDCDQPPAHVYQQGSSIHSHPKHRAPTHSHTKVLLW